MTVQPKRIPQSGPSVPNDVADALADAVEIIRRTQLALGGAYIAIRADYGDGHPVSVNGGPGGSGADGLPYGDRTGNAIITGGHLAHDQLRSIALRLRMLALAAESVTHRWHARSPEHLRVPECNGGQGMDGAIVWGRPYCHMSAVTLDGLCDPCRQRRGAWRRANEAREAIR